MMTATEPAKIFSSDVPLFTVVVMQFSPVQVVLGNLEAIDLFPLTVELQFYADSVLKRVTKSDNKEWTSEAFWVWSGYADAILIRELSSTSVDALKRDHPAYAEYKRYIARIAEQL